jgi:hypothetical protein
MKKLVLTRESPCLQPVRRLVEEQKHRTLVMWAVDCAGRLLALFENRVLTDRRPREAVEAAKRWARGEIKMPAAQMAALAAHKAATDVLEDPAACAAARATGHVVGTVHVETHAMGVVMYGLKAFVYDANEENAGEVIERECGWFYGRLLHWQSNIGLVKGPWAPFLLRDDVVNKEKLLRQKMERERIKQTATAKRTPGHEAGSAIWKNEKNI